MIEQKHKIIKYLSNKIEITSIEVLNLSVFALGLIFIVGIGLSGYLIFGEKPPIWYTFGSFSIGFLPISLCGIFIAIKQESPRYNRRIKVKGKSAIVYGILGTVVSLWISGYCLMLMIQELMN